MTKPATDRFVQMVEDELADCGEFGKFAATAVARLIARIRQEQEDRDAMQHQLGEKIWHWRDAMTRAETAEADLEAAEELASSIREKTIKECMATVEARLEPYDFVAGEFALEALSALLEPKP